MRKLTPLFALFALLAVASASNYFFNWYVPLFSGSSGNSTGGTNVTCGDNFFLCSYAGSQVTLTLNQTYTNTQYWAYAPIPWGNLSSVPAACPAGQAFTNLSGAGTCNAFLNETPYQSSAGGWANTTNTTKTNYNATINGTLNVSDDIYATNFYGNINASYVQNLPNNGTVTSIAVTAPGLTGGTITASGTIALNTTYTDGRYLQAIPYQSSAAGFTNTSTTTSTSLNISASAGIIVATTTAVPTCAAGYRGMVWVTQGGVGVADIVYACLKNAANSYNWVQVAIG